MLQLLFIHLRALTSLVFNHKKSVSKYIANTCTWKKQKHCISPIYHYLIFCSCQVLTMVLVTTNTVAVGPSRPQTMLLLLGCLITVAAVKKTKHKRKDIRNIVESQFNLLSTFLPVPELSSNSASNRESVGNKSSLVGWRLPTHTDDSCPCHVWLMLAPWDQAPLSWDPN